MLFIDTGRFLVNILDSGGMSDINPLMPLK